MNGVRLVKPTIVQQHDLIKLGLPRNAMACLGFHFKHLRRRRRRSELRPGSSASAEPPITMSSSIIRRYRPTMRASSSLTVRRSSRISARPTAPPLVAQKIESRGRPFPPATSSILDPFRCAECAWSASMQRGENSLATIPLEEKTVVFGRSRLRPGARRSVDLLATCQHLQCRRLGAFEGSRLDQRHLCQRTSIIAPVPVRPDDVIHLGTFALRLAGNGTLENRSEQGNVTIEARNVTVEVSGRRLLEKVSLTVFPTEFVGLMGPSGAGKTTLMNCAQRVYAANGRASFAQWARPLRLLRSIRDLPGIRAARRHHPSRAHRGRGALILPRDCGCPAITENPKFINASATC